MVQVITAAGFVEVVLHVVAVDLGPTEDDGFVHVVNCDCTQRVLTFQYLHGLRQHLCATRTNQTD